MIMSSRSFLLLAFLGYLLISCSQGNSVPDVEDPFSGLPEINFSVMDITDKGSTNPDEFYFRSYYFNDMKLSKEGGLYVNFFRAPGILEFGPSGNFRGLIGSRGSGPGEFQFTPKFDHSDDQTLYALDPQSKKLVKFDRNSSEWTLVNEFIIQSDDISRFDDIQVFDKDRVGIHSIPALQLYMRDNTPDSLFRKSVDIYMNGELYEEGFITSESDDFSAFVMENGGAIFADTPYGSRRIIEKGREGSTYYLDTKEFCIYILDKDGSKVDSIAYPDYTMQIPDTSRRNRAEEIGASSGTEEGDRKMKDMIYSDIPEVGHPLKEMFVDEYTGYILLSREKIYPEPHWLVLDEQGKRVGTLNLDPDLKVFDFANGRIAGNLMKEEIPPTVQVLTIHIN